MNSAETTTSAPSADSTNPTSPVSESPTISIPGRVGMAMFLIVGFLLGVVILVDLLSSFFR
jgi:hypothetical protein